MRRKQRRMFSTTIAIFLSLNIQVQSEGGPVQLLTFPLLGLTSWLLGWWQVQATIRRRYDALKAGIVELNEQLRVPLVLVTIGFRSLLYGVGIAF